MASAFNASVNTNDDEWLLQTLLGLDAALIGAL
jgi:hypothetical protein